MINQQYFYSNPFLKWPSRSIPIKRDGCRLRPCLAKLLLPLMTLIRQLQQLYDFVNERFGIADTIILNGQVPIAKFVQVAFRLHVVDAFLELPASLLSRRLACVDPHRVIIERIFSEELDICFSPNIADNDDRFIAWERLVNEQNRKGKPNWNPNYFSRSLLCRNILNPPPGAHRSTQSFLSDTFPCTVRHSAGPPSSVLSLSPSATWWALRFEWSARRNCRVWNRKMFKSTDWKTSRSLPTFWESSRRESPSRSSSFHWLKLTTALWPLCLDLCGGIGRELPFSERTVTMWNRISWPSVEAWSVQHSSLLDEFLLRISLPIHMLMCYHSIETERCNNIRKFQKE